MLFPKGSTVKFADSIRLDAPLATMGSDGVKGLGLDSFEAA